MRAEVLLRSLMRQLLVAAVECDAHVQQPSSVTCYLGQPLDTAYQFPLLCRLYADW